jgi:nucleoside-diphosphate-sugar epimerase
MVHTSTSETYGSALYEPIDEAHPLQGQSPYSASKIGADKLAESYFLSFETPVAIIRPFNTYGPRQSARAVIPTIISQLVAGKKEIDLGALSPKRDLTFVEDTVRGFMQVAASDSALGQVTNVGSGKTIAIGQLADLIIGMIDTSAKVVSRDDRVRPDRSEVTTLICNNERARKTIGWQPTFSLEHGLERTIEFIRDHMDAFEVERYNV